MIQYLTETLGLRYFPLPQLESIPEVSLSLEAPPDFTKLVFVLTDLEDAKWSSTHESTFQNMIKALGLKPDEVFKMGPISISHVDYFSRMRSWNCQAPSVFLSLSPELSGAVQSLGSHNWVEIYSFSEMIKKPELKKISWKTLQALQTKGF